MCSLEHAMSMCSLEQALSVLAAEVCVQINPCIPSVCRNLKTTSQPPDDSVLCTWLCKDPLFFTLFKTEPSSPTLLYSHANEVLYYASVLAQLSSSCPPATGFLCQFTHDSLPEGLTPRLLVFDVLSPQIMPAAARGDFMRALSAHIPQPLCCVQWIGPRRYLSDEFIRGLPHPISGVLYLLDDPGCVGCVDV